MRRYSMVIIEDEWLERSALKKMIQKQYPQINPIFCAGESKEAMDIIEKNHPDILFVDINLPGLSGIELLRKLSEMKYTGKYVITTAYDRSSYIRKAMELGCVGYILKPLSEKEVERMMSKCFAKIELEENAKLWAERCESVQQYAEAFLARDILEGDLKQNVLMKGYGWPKDGELYAFFCCLSCENMVEEEKIQEASEIIKKCLTDSFLVLASIAEHQILLLIQAQKDLENQQIYTSLWCLLTVGLRKIEAKTEQKWMVRLSGAWNTYADLQKTYSQREDFVPLTFETRGGGRRPYLKFLFQNHRNKDIDKKKKRQVMQKKIVQRLRENKEDRVLSMVHKFIAEGEDKWIILQFLIEAILMWNTEIEVEELLKIWRQEEYLSDFQLWLKKIIQKNSLILKNPPENCIETALEILEHRCGEPLSEEEVAETLGLSQAYFSRLFKQKTGKTYTTVLRNIRITKAKQMMTEGKYNINEIAVSCGFSSIKYFYSVFQKIEGEDPIAYYRRAKKTNEEKDK